MSNYQEYGSDAKARIPQKKLEETLLEMANYRKQMIWARAAGHVIDERTARGLHAAVMTCYTELRAYRDESAIRNTWQEKTLWSTPDGDVTGVDSLGEWLNKTTTEKQELPGRRSGHKEVETSATLPPEKAFAASLALDDVARELGVSIEVATNHDRNDPSMSDLRGLLVQRGQKPALENLPGGDADGDD